MGSSLQLANHKPRPALPHRIKSCLPPVVPVNALVLAEGGEKMLKTNQSACSAIERWEEAGNIHSKVLDDYLHLCLSLETDAPRDGTIPKNLATRIDSALESLHMTVNQRIANARSALARTRNKIIAPVYRLPAEVLSEIFSYALYQPANPCYHISMVDNLIKMHRMLHSLLGVCTTWKNVALARGSFWSTVPMIPSDPSELRLGFPKATQLSLERADSADLHLAAIIPHWPDDPLSSSLAQHALQFRTINIETECDCVTSHIVDMFEDACASGRLSGLFIHHKSNKQPFNIAPRAFNYVIDPSTETLPKFNQILKSLSEFRLRGAPLDLNDALFSNRLVELDLQQFTLGYDSEISKLVTALASATELRTLKFASVTTFLNPEGSQEKTSQNISLPKLQTLLAQDLYANTLKSLLSAITSRTHLLTLYLTRKTLHQLSPGEAPECISFYDLADVFSSSNVNTLLLDGEKRCYWMRDGDLTAILNSVPDLKTLHMHNWGFEDDFCRELQRRLKNGVSAYPHIENLYITSAVIWDVGVFQDMVTSYSESLERMELGAKLLIDRESEGEDDGFEWNPVDDDDELVEWLEDNVPEFKLVDSSYIPKEFDPLKWQLW